MNLDLRPPERFAEDWCRYSATCYLRGTKVRTCVPEAPANVHSLRLYQPYEIGCPGNESECTTARWYNRMNVRNRLEEIG